MSRKSRRARLIADDPFDTAPDPFETADHVIGRVHGCMLCDDNEGAVLVTLRIHRDGKKATMTERVNVAFRLCSDCRDDRSVALSLEAREDLNRRGDELLATERFEGCPCCSWDVCWHACEAPENVWVQ